CTSRRSLHARDCLSLVRSCPLFLRLRLTDRGHGSLNSTGGIDRLAEIVVPLRRVVARMAKQRLRDADVGRVGNGKLGRPQLAEEMGIHGLSQLPQRDVVDALVDLLWTEHPA